LTDVLEIATVAPSIISSVHLPCPPEKKTKQPTDNFEKSMDELESLVETMESGELTLEASLEHFEQGIKKVRQCQKALDEAEQKVKILLDDAEEGQLAEFDPDE